MSTCILITGSVTLAMKAKRILLSHSIFTEITKLSSDAQGCRYGIRIPSIHKENAKKLLRSDNLYFEELCE